MSNALTNTDFEPTVEQSYPAIGETVRVPSQVVTIDGSTLGYNRKEVYLNPYFFVFGDPGKEWLLPFQNMT